MPEQSSSSPIPDASPSQPESALAAASLPLGFSWGAVQAGIKASGKPDLALALAPAGASAAAMFTSNRVVAAPVTVGRQHLAATRGRVTAVLVNAGNANCATGTPGIEACNQTCVAVAETFHCIFDEVFPSSTGIIGVPFPTQKVLDALPALKASLGDTADHATRFANAILTTDTRQKVAHAVIDADPASGRTVSLFGAAKGAGMIHPQLASQPGPPHATMLVYLFTDLLAEPDDLSALLHPAVEHSFNSISIDGDTSTNDTVLLLASGASGVSLTPALRASFAQALERVCASLAHQIIDDGEGVTHVVTLHIRGTRDEAEARQLAKSIAHSPLCKTAWSSADPNWGRLLAAAGYSGVPVDPARITIHIGPHLVFAEGVRAPSYDPAAAHQTMLAREFTITIDLHTGPAECRFLTCDLTAEYVAINADYST